MVSQMGKQQARRTFAGGSDEIFRATMQGRTPEGEITTLIVLRRGLGRGGRVWLTFQGAIATTVVMTDPEAGTLIGLINDAQGAS